MIKHRINNIIINNTLNSKVGFELIKSNFQNSILTYHGVSDQVCKFNSRHVTTKNFVKQIKFLKKYCHIITLDDFVNGNFDPKKINVALTFDDGYQNNLLNVKPILEQFKIPATFFITGINSINQDFLWADYVEIFQTLTKGNFTIDEFDFIYKDNTFYDKNTNQNIHQIIKFIKPEFDFKQKIYDLTPKEIKEKIFNTPQTYWKVMSDSEIIKASRSNFISIQSHGMLHNNLGNISLENSKSEILNSKKYLENLTQKEVYAIGYPDGSYNKETINICEDIGIKHQFATDYFLTPEDLNDERILSRKGIFDIGSYKNQLYNSLKTKNPTPKKSKKILHIIPCLAGGGAEILLGQIAIEQVRQGFEVHILLLDKDHFTYENYPFKNELETKTTIHKIICETKFSVFHNGISINTNKIDQLISVLLPDIIHSHLYKSEIVAHHKILKNTTYISHLHDNMPQFEAINFETKKLKSRFISYTENKWILNQYLKSDNKFISISKDTTHYFKKNLPYSLRKNIFEINNAINIENFCSKKREELPKKLFFLNVGNLVEKKRTFFIT